jgi:hypothetical protein
MKLAKLPRSHGRRPTRRPRGWPNRCRAVGRGRQTRPPSPAPDINSYQTAWEGLKGSPFWQPFGQLRPPRSEADLSGGRAAVVATLAAGLLTVECLKAGPDPQGIGQQTTPASPRENLVSGPRVMVVGLDRNRVATPQRASSAVQISSSHPLDSETRIQARWAAIKQALHARARVLAHQHAEPLGGGPFVMVGPV